MRLQSVGSGHEESSHILTGGLKSVSLMKRQETSWFACSLPVSPFWSQARCLGSSSCMQALSCFKGAALIGFALVPHRKDVGWEADEVPCQPFFDFLPRVLKSA